MSQSSIGQDFRNVLEMRELNFFITFTPPDPAEVAGKCLKRAPRKIEDQYWLGGDSSCSKWNFSFLSVVTEPKGSLRHGCPSIAWNRQALAACVKVCHSHCTRWVWLYTPSNSVKHLMPYSPQSRHCHQLSRGWWCSTRGINIYNV